MLVFKISGVIIGLVLLCSSAVSQTAAPAKPPAKQAAKKKVEDFAAEIKKLRDTWTQEFNAGHADKIAALYAPEATLMRYDGSVHGPDQIRGELQRSLDFGASGYSISSLHAERSGDLGYDTGAYNVTLKDGRVVEGNYVVVVKRFGGEWKIVAHATTANPFPPPPDALK